MNTPGKAGPTWSRLSFRVRVCTSHLPSLSHSPPSMIWTPLDSLDGPHNGPQFAPIPEWTTRNGAQFRLAVMMSDQPITSSSHNQVNPGSDRRLYSTESSAPHLASISSRPFSTAAALEARRLHLVPCEGSDWGTPGACSWACA